MPSSWSVKEREGHMQPSRLLMAIALLAASMAALNTCAQTIPPPAQNATPRRGIQPDLSHPILPIGSPAPDFSLMGIDDKRHTLGEYAHAKVLAIVFESDHCPVSENYETRIRAIYQDYKDKGVAVVAINPNNPSAVRLNELGYTDLTDSFPDMKLRAANRHMAWPFLYDGDTQALAGKFGASATPHIFIFDQDRKLRYEGRIDDNQTQSLVKSHDARNAIDALLAGKDVAVSHTPAFGCSTKWLSKAGDVEAEMEKIKAEPVELQMAGVDTLRKLRANGSGKIVVVTFWSPQCRDCATTFHDLQTTYRMYRLRDFNLVTVSTEEPENKEAVLKFLKAQYASSTNFQIDTNLSAVKVAFGAQWKTEDSFTMVIAPDGRTIYQREGKFDIAEMRRAILANMPDGRAYAGQHAYWSETVKN